MTAARYWSSSKHGDAAEAETTGAASLPLLASWRSDRISTQLRTNFQLGNGFIHRNVIDKDGTRNLEMQGKRRRDEDDNIMDVGILLKTAFVPNMFPGSGDSLKCEQIFHAPYQALNRNGRRPKKANKGKRPCSSWGRKNRRKKAGRHRLKNI